MALTDSFNAVYNKKEQSKIERQKIKLHDELLEMELLESLQALQLDYITKNDKNMLLLPKTKNDLINEIINTNSTKILKNSKYMDSDFQKAYLLKKYDIITNKTLRLAKTFDKIQEEKEAEELKKELENANIVEISRKQAKTKININWSKILTVCGYIAIAPLFILWGIIDGICKNKK